MASIAEFERELIRERTRSGIEARRARGGRFGRPKMLVSSGTRDKAADNSIRNLRWIRENFGKGRWRKMKGIAKVRTETDRIRTAELHWYEAHGIGSRGGRVKRYLD